MSTGARFDTCAGLHRSCALPGLRSSGFRPVAVGLTRMEPKAVADATRRAAGIYGPGGRAARAATLAAPLLATRPEVIHVEFSGIGVALLDALEPLEPSTRLVFSCRGTGELVTPVVKPSVRPALARLFCCVDAVHAVADAVATATVDLGADPRSVQVIRPAVDLEQFTQDQPHHDRSGAAQVVTVGRLHWVKGIELQLAAATDLVARGHEFRWAVVSDGPEWTALELRSHSRGLDGVVEFVGARPGDEVRDLPLGADQFALSSWSGGYCELRTRDDGARGAGGRDRRRWNGRGAHRWGRRTDDGTWRCR